MNLLGSDFGGGLQWRWSYAKVPGMQRPTQRLIGAEVSYYTGKVRAYLRYKQIPFEEILATREVYRDVIVPRTGVRFIPVLISDDDVAVQDSAAILDFLDERYPEPSIRPEGSLGQLLALLLEAYADEWLLLPAMHYRWNIPENRAFAIEAFGQLSVPQATPEEQRAIGEKLAGPFAGALTPLGIDASTAPAIEASYRELLAELESHFHQHPFLLGERPSRGDFALFGPLYAHLYRDPASGRMMKQLAPRVATWVERMRDPAAPSGRFLPDDALPGTLDPVLARMFREFGPVLADTIARLADAQALADGTLPRSLGTHTFLLNGAQGQRAIYPFNVWRWQAARDHYDGLAPDARVRADRLLERVGGLELMHAPPPRRLTRVANRLRFADSR
jgi:glutathione S-transferase